MIRTYFVISLVFLAAACTVNFQIEATSAAQQGDGTLTETLRELETTRTNAELDAKVDSPLVDKGL